MRMTFKVIQSHLKLRDSTGYVSLPTSVCSNSV